MEFQLKLTCVLFSMRDEYMLITHAECVADILHDQKRAWSWVILRKRLVLLNLAF